MASHFGRLPIPERMIGRTRSQRLKNMVDISTAMQAARAEAGKKKSGGGSKKRRPGGVLGVEPFDPADHVEKEVGDALSMWLVIVAGSMVSLSCAMS